MFRLSLIAAFAALLGTSCTNLAGVANTALKVGMAKLMFSCIPEGVEIDTPQGAIAIQMIRPGDTVIGYGGEPVRVLQVHAYSEDPSRARFYRLGFADGSEVAVCDLHRIAGRPAHAFSAGDTVAGKELRSISVFRGVERSYDLLTEDAGYQIDGVPVNSMIAEMARHAADLNAPPNLPAR